VRKIFHSASLTINDTIFKLFDDYRKYVDSPGDIVYQVFIDQSPDSIVLYLTFVQYHAELYKYKPTEYFKIDKDLFIIYSGTDPLCSPDTIFLKNLQNEVALIDLKEKEEVPTLYENTAWSLTYYQKNKSFLLKKRAPCPYKTFDYVIDY
jgi:hypothetical protein